MDHLNPKQRAFLAAYAKIGTLSGAAEAAKIARRNHSNWMKDAEYAADFAAAEERAIETLEAEARRRAERGVEEPVIYQGQLQFEPKRDRYGRTVKDLEGKVVYSTTPLTVRKPSDILLMFLLKAKRPDVYRDNAAVQMTGPGGEPLSITVRFVNDASNGRKTS
jgi:hypothetical protein